MQMKRLRYTEGSDLPKVLAGREGCPKLDPRTPGPAPVCQCLCNTNAMSISHSEHHSLWESWEGRATLGACSSPGVQATLSPTQIPSC